MISSDYQPLKEVIVQPKSPASATVGAAMRKVENLSPSKVSNSNSSIFDKKSII